MSKSSDSRAASGNRDIVVKLHTDYPGDDHVQNLTRCNHSELRGRLEFDRFGTTLSEPIEAFNLGPHAEMILWLSVWGVDGGYIGDVQLSGYLWIPGNVFVLSDLVGAGLVAP